MFNDTFIVTSTVTDETGAEVHVSVEYDLLTSWNKAAVCLFFIAMVLAVFRGLSNHRLFGLGMSGLGAVCMIAAMGIYEGKSGFENATTFARREAYYFGWISCVTNIMMMVVAFL